MPARDEEHEIGKCHGIGEPRRQGVAGEVIDAHQRQACRRSDPLGAHDAGENPADQARTGCHGDGVDLGETDPRLSERLFHANVDFFGMGPRRNLGDDAAIGLVQRGLAKDDRGKHLGPILPTPHHRRGGIIAARFDAEDGEAFLHAGSGCAGFNRR